jgi:hypothetical protein
MSVNSAGTPSNNGNARFVGFSSQFWSLYFAGKKKAEALNADLLA